jgi:hypothetical protein
VHTPRNYGALRDEHSSALAALDQHIEQSETPDVKNGVEPSAQEQLAGLGAEAEPEPTRPENVRQSSPAWEGLGDMISEQAAANTRYTWIVAELDGRDQGQVNVDPVQASAELAAYADGQQTDAGRGAGGQEAAQNALDQHIESAERGNIDIGQDFRDASREILDVGVEV